MEPVLGFRNLRKSFETEEGRSEVLKGVNLEVFSGDLVCVLGGSGSGKSVLMQCYNGLNTPDSGEVFLFGKSLRDLSETEREEILLQTGYVFQGNALFSGTVYDNCALWFRQHTSEKESEIEKIVRRAIEEVELDFELVRNKSRLELSGGMQKRVAIARTVAYEPKIIVYDEPTTGLPPETVKKVDELIRKFHDQDPGRASIIVTHDIESVRILDGKIAFLKEGIVRCYDSYDRFAVSQDGQAYLPKEFRTLKVA